MESLTMLSRKVIPLFSLTAFSCLMADAQGSNGTIVGTITETSGAVASKARVTVRNIETGMERNVTIAEVTVRKSWETSDDVLLSNS